MKKILLFLLLCVCYTSSIAEKPSKMVACFACHGESGLSPNPGWPHLAGQHASYLRKQLQDYKNGSRKDLVMTPISRDLTPDEIKELASYFAKKPLPRGSSIAKSVFEKGERLYRGGDFAKGITACIACHGPKAMGNAQAGFPLLAGQNAIYTLQQMQDFKKNKRVNDLNSIMRGISSRMSKQDMEALAYYIQSLPSLR